MPLLRTRYFGVIEYAEDSCIEFPLGIPAFDDQKKFALLEDPQRRPFLFIQSVAQESLCFVVLPIGIVDPEYSLQITGDEAAVTGLHHGSALPSESTLLLTLVSISERNGVTANLLAPVVVHLETRRAVQAIRGDSKYSHQHVVLPRHASREVNDADPAPALR